jgi:hypothetical protein
MEEKAVRADLNGRAQDNARYRGSAPDTPVNSAFRWPGRPVLIEANLTSLQLSQMDNVAAPLDQTPPEPFAFAMVLRAMKRSGSIMVHPGHDMPSMSAVAPGSFG